MTVVPRLLKLLAFAVMFLQPPLGFAENAKIVVDEPEFHFGEVFQGEKVTHAFVVHNQGDGPLLIERIRSSCGCTAALASAKEIPPGQTGEVRATFDSTRFSGMVVKTIYVYTNDPSQKVMQLHLRGEVREELKITPARVNFPPVQAEEETKVQVSILNNGRETIQFSNIRTTAREVTATVSRNIISPGEKTEFELVAKLAKGTPQVNGYLLVSTNSLLLPELRIPFRAQLTP